jgi:predicted RNA-binding Zn-ribbon protein involved in translation (DUF1610 family)
MEGGPVMNFDIQEFLLYLFAAALMIFVAVYIVEQLIVFFFLRTKNRMRWECRICGMRFYAERGAHVQACPHCGAVNKYRKTLRH